MNDPTPRLVVSHPATCCWQPNLYKSDQWRMGGLQFSFFDNNLQTGPSVAYNVRVTDRNNGSAEILPLINAQ